MLRRRLLSFATTLLAAGAASCAAILGFERLSEDGLPLEDAGVDAADGAAIQDSSAADQGAPGPCGEIGIVGPPADAAAGTAPPLILALRLLDFGVDVDGGRPDVPGYNLDRACSPTIATSTCTTAVLESTFAKSAADKSTAGLDNAGFSLIEYIGGFSKLLSAESINDGIREGRYGAVLRVTGWNGQLDDDALQIEVFPAIGILPRDDGGTTGDFDDRWVLDARFEVAPGAGASRVKSDTAWITGGHLVARFSSATLPILLSDDPKPFDMTLTDAILTAEVTTADGGPSLVRGVVAGRWKTSDFLGQVRTIYVKDGSGLVDKTLCDDDSTARIIYGAVKKEICDARDIRSDSQDHAEPKQPCDALSAGMRVEAYPIATLGVFEAGAPIAPRCESDTAVPAGDDCP
ncbi:MAG: hypothetical protein KIT84_22990 [Labilithrix sp.]|nr:hypothetical protein [Labilithrix sp.]MCW5813912.1 hypothetical protein [Labilithrix sp.]